jgi:hypothetical protein
MWKMLCVVAFIIAIGVMFMFFQMPESDYTLTFSVNSNHIIFLKLEYLRYLASKTLYNTDFMPCGEANLSDAFLLFRNVGDISGDFSDFVYSLSDAATSQDVFYGPGRVFTHDLPFEEYICPLKGNKAIDLDSDMTFLAINVSFLINHYAQGKPRLSEMDFLETEFFESKPDIKYCFFGDLKSITRKNFSPVTINNAPKKVSISKKYFVGLVLEEMSQHDAFYMKVFTLMKEGFYFRDLNENPYNGGSVLITTIPRE